MHPACKPHGRFWLRTHLRVECKAGAGQCLRRPLRLLLAAAALQAQPTQLAQADRVAAQLLDKARCAARLPPAACPWLKLDRRSRRPHTRARHTPCCLSAAAPLVRVCDLQGGQRGVQRCRAESGSGAPAVHRSPPMACSKPAPRRAWAALIALQASQATRLQTPQRPQRPAAASTHRGSDLTSGSRQRPAVSFHARLHSTLGWQQHALGRAAAV